MAKYSKTDCTNFELSVTGLGKESRMSTKHQSMYWPSVFSTAKDEVGVFAGCTKTANLAKEHSAHRVHSWWLESGHVECHSVLYSGACDVQISCRVSQAQWRGGAAADEPGALSINDLSLEFGDDGTKFDLLRRRTTEDCLPVFVRIEKVHAEESEFNNSRFIAG